MDMAQAETAAYFLGVSYLEAAVNQREPEPVGNDWAYAAPHNCYPCRGDDRWCVVAVETNDQWQALCRVIARDDLAADARYATLTGRRAHRPSLDAAVAEWMSQQDAHAAMQCLQEAGVPAGVVQSGEDLLRDPQLRARGFIGEVDHPTLGRSPVAGQPMSIAPSGLEPASWTAELGKHNEYVYCDLLGYSREQLRHWQTAGIVR
jgi:benzylsuccinate CoA-transferase BbsF subunit